jgi:hypothetical protein
MMHKNIVIITLSTSLVALANNIQVSNVAIADPTPISPPSGPTNCPFRGLPQKTNSQQSG